jgi:hypothetical protein
VIELPVIDAETFEAAVWIAVIDVLGPVTLLPSAVALITELTVTFGVGTDAAAAQPGVSVSVKLKEDGVVKEPLDGLLVIVQPVGATTETLLTVTATPEAMLTPPSVQFDVPFAEVATVTETGVQERVKFALVRAAVAVTGKVPSELPLGLEMVKETDPVAPGKAEAVGRIYTYPSLSPPDAFVGPKSAVSHDAGAVSAPNVKFHSQPAVRPVPVNLSG